MTELTTYPSTVRVCPVVTYRVIPHADDDVFIMAAYCGGRAIAVVAASLYLEVVEFIGTHPAQRRQGVARALLAAAREHTGLRLDFDGGERSADGRAFSRAVGLKRGPCRRYLSGADMEAHLTDLLTAINAR